MLSFTSAYETDRKLGIKKLNDIALVEAYEKGQTSFFYKFKVPSKDEVYEAICDAEDKSLLDQYYWTVVIANNKPIIRTIFREGDNNSSRTMMSIIMHHTGASKVSCIDGDFLNMRRSNLQPRFRSETFMFTHEEKLRDITSFDEFYTITEGLTKKNKGDLFEIFTYHLFKNDPRLNNKFDKVWLYSDIPQKYKDVLKL